MRRSRAPASRRTEGSQIQSGNGYCAASPSMKLRTSRPWSSMPSAWGTSVTPACRRASRSEWTAGVHGPAVRRTVRPTRVTRVELPPVRTSSSSIRPNLPPSTFAQDRGSGRPVRSPTAWTVASTASLCAPPKLDRDVPPPAGASVSGSVMTDRLMLLDTASLYFRAFYGVPDTVRRADGTPGQRGARAARHHRAARHRLRADASRRVLGRRLAPAVAGRPHPDLQDAPRRRGRGRRPRRRGRARPARGADADHPPRCSSSPASRSSARPSTRPTTSSARSPRRAEPAGRRRDGRPRPLPARRRRARRARDLHRARHEQPRDRDRRRRRREVRRAARPSTPTSRPCAATPPTGCRASPASARRPPRRCSASTARSTRCSRRPRMQGAGCPPQCGRSSPRRRTTSRSRPPS